MPDQLFTACKELMASIDHLGTALVVTGMLAHHIIAETQTARQVLYLEFVGFPSKVAKYKANNLTCKLHKGETHLIDNATVTKIVQDVVHSGTDRTMAHGGMDRTMVHGGVDRTMVQASTVFDGLAKAAASSLACGAQRHGSANAGCPFVLPTVPKAKTRMVFKAHTLSASANAGKKGV